MQTALSRLLKEKFFGKRVLVVGLGIQGGGVGLARFLCEFGAKVKVTDLKGENELKELLRTLTDLKIDYTLGLHKRDDFLNTDIIFKGPSVPWTLSELKEAEENGIPVEMEVSFFASLCPSPLIGVTGTRGKSTTAMMIYEVLKRKKSQVYLAGNISGVSTISLLKNVSKNSVVVLELSSWQLSGFHRKKLSPHIAVFTNFYPDHLNYYESLQPYFYDKKAIYLYQKKKDILVVNTQLKGEIEKEKPQSKIFYFKNGDFPKKLRYLSGAHNLENAAAALGTVRTLGIDHHEAANIIAQLRGLPYRQEVVFENERVMIVNDSASTTPTSTMKAIETFDIYPIILIIGGDSKHLPYQELADRLDGVKKIIFLKGSFTDEILPVLRKSQNIPITRIYDNFTEVLHDAKDTVSQLDQKAVILFSPSATSFSLFKNEFHRGEEFNKAVKKLFGRLSLS